MFSSLARRAFFPLASQSLEAWPLNTYTGVGLGASVVSDPLFGSALKCSRDDTGLVSDAGLSPAAVLLV